MKILTAYSATARSPRHPVEIAPTWGGFNPIQVNLTECLLSDIGKNAVSFSYQRVRFPPPPPIKSRAGRIADTGYARQWPGCTRVAPTSNCLNLEMREVPRLSLHPARAVAIARGVAGGGTHEIGSHIDARSDQLFRAM
jgi:hypothetical protein